MIIRNWRENAEARDSRELSTALCKTLGTLKYDLLITKLEPCSFDL